VFLAHLVAGFKEAKVPHYVYRIGNNTEKKKRDFGLGVEYRNLSLKDAVAKAKKQPSLVVAINAKEPWAYRAFELVKAGAMPLIHDPNDLRPNVEQILKNNKKPIFTIRPTVQELLVDKGYEVLNFQHPYAGTQITPERDKHAVSISRIDFEKHIEIIAEANKLLPKNRRVKIHGFIFRPYAQHTLDKKFKGWRKNYVDAWGPHELYGGVMVASQAKFVVDMSSIKNDGGGTQYTFLEAWNGGARLILNEDWLVEKPYYNAVEEAAAFVSGPEELAEELQKPNKGKTKEAWVRRRKAALSLLMRHNAPNVALTFNTAMKLWS
jgi:hypothetical protein